MKTSPLRRKIRKWLLFVITTLVFTVFLYKAVTIFFSIRAIEIVGNGMQIVVDEKKISRTLLFFPSDRMRAEILRNNPLLADVRFQKKYPHTLIITPVVRSAFVRLQSYGRTVLLDREGFVLVDGDQGTTLPVLRFSIPALRVGERVVDRPVQQSLAIIDILRHSLYIDMITEQDGPYVRVKTRESDIFIPQDKDVTEILATLQTLMTGFRIKGTLPAVVDLRFDKPVIKF